MDNSQTASLIEMGFVYAVVLAWAAWELWKVRKPKAPPAEREQGAGSGEAGHPERQQNLDP